MSIVVDTAPAAATTALQQEAQYLVQRWSPSLDAQAHACILESAVTNDMPALILLRDRGGFSIEVGLVESLAAGHLELFDECIRQKNRLMSMTQQKLWLLAAGGREAIWLAAARAKSLDVLEHVAKNIAPPSLASGVATTPQSRTFLKQLYATADSVSAVLFVRSKISDLPPLEAAALPLRRIDMLRAVVLDEFAGRCSSDHAAAAQKLADELLALATGAGMVEAVLQICAGDLVATLLPPASALARRTAASIGGATLPYLLALPDATWPAWALPAHAAAGALDTVNVLLNHLPLAVVDSDEEDRSMKVYLAAAHGHLKYQMRGSGGDDSATATLQRLHQQLYSSSSST